MKNEQRYSSAAANAFGSGSELIGMQCKGKKIVSATRKNMILENGDVVPRKGNRVSFRIETKSEWNSRVAHASAHGYTIKEERFGPRGYSDSYRYWVILNGQYVTPGLFHECPQNAMSFIERRLDGVQ